MRDQRRTRTFEPCCLTGRRCSNAITRNRAAAFKCMTTRLPTGRRTVADDRGGAALTVQYLCPGCREDWAAKYGATRLPEEARG
ncbi:MAG: hypothetical protein IH945_03505 [Armatimonadetes bacterium]|nr:hypothetical protein [Armatimonadota bacterium]